jgi:hydrogenase expression/formation protein HypE
MIMDKILLGHGSGGRLMHSLIREYIAPQFDMKMLADSAVLDGDIFLGGKLAFTTDSYVVSPLFFPGGNIGELAVNGTVNDLSMQNRSISQWALSSKRASPWILFAKF